MLKLIVHHSPALVGFLIALNLKLRRPQFDHIARIADALIVAEGKHKTIASLYELIVDAPDASNGCDSLRISPWRAEDIRKSVCDFVIDEVVTYSQKTGEKTLYVSLDDSLGEKDKATRKLEAVEFHHDHTKSTKKKAAHTNGTSHVALRLQIGEMNYAFSERLYLREKTVRRLNRQRPKEQRLRFRKKGSRAQEMLAELKELLPPGFQLYLLFDSWYASWQNLKLIHRSGRIFFTTLKSNRLVSV